MVYGYNIMVTKVRLLMLHGYIIIVIEADLLINGQWIQYNGTEANFFN